MIPTPVSLYVSEGLGTETERAWAAGFFDGEGWITFSHDKRPNRRTGIFVGISQVDDRPLMRFKSATGYLGRIVPEKRLIKNRQRIYRIVSSNAQSLFLLNAIWPWMSAPKKEQFFRVFGKVERGRYPGPTPTQLLLRHKRLVSTEGQWVP